MEEINTSHLIAKVINGGFIGSNKAADINRQMDLPAITNKDRKAIAIGKEMGGTFWDRSTRLHSGNPRETDPSALVRRFLDRRI